MRLNSGLLLTVALTLLCWGCGGDQIKAAGMTLPSWFAQPPAGCATGSQPFVKNMNLAKAGATGKGRTALARELKTRVTAMLKDYASEGGTLKGNFSESQTDDVSRQFTDLNMNGARAVKVHISEGSQTVFHALVCIDAAKLAESLDQMKVLDAKTRAALKSRVKAAFKELDAHLK